ncbi:MAG: GNAT family N-acetyltransferase [Candidatus Izimaplasma sp.]|nr:GNAT family N-acetyltransferase [Candidatus Izimaplasma bacterium]
MKFLKDNSVLDIQEAKQKDAKEILDFLKQVREESKFLVLDDTGINKTLEEQEAYLADLRNKITSKLFIGRVGGEIIASGGIYHREESIEGNVILDINILADYLGLGTEEHILNHVINYARITTEISSIDILTSKDNQAMISIYKKLGFKELDVENEELSLNPKNEEVVYRLTI